MHRGRQAPTEVLQAFTSENFILQNEPLKGTSPLNNMLLHKIA